jgi:MFS family permease
VGLLVALQKVAFPILGLPVGVWIDRLPRRPVMIVADLGRALALASVPIAAVSGHLSLPLLFAVAVVMGVLRLFFDVAYLAYVPALVGKERLVDANSRMQVSDSVAAITGPGIAGFLAQAIGAAQAIALDAFSFLVSAASVAWIRTSEAGAERARIGWWKELREGVGVVFGSPVLTSMITLVAAFSLAGHVGGDILTVFVYRNLRLTPALVGVLFAAEGLAAIAGALFAGRVAAALGVGPALAWTGVLTGAAIGALPLALVAPPLLTLAVLFVVTGAANTVHDINQLTLRQRLTPDHLQGRMNATFRTVYWGAQPLGGVLGGWLGATIGVPQTIALGGVCAAVLSLAVLLTPLGRFRQAYAQA